MAALRFTHSSMSFESNFPQDWVWLIVFTRARHFTAARRPSVIESTRSKGPSRHAIWWNLGFRRGVPLFVPLCLK
jgi:hypothetical protein